ncbi:hypothetical protein J4760_04135 [Salinicoccus sp. ID82-1]|uniref:hypothetical protein n=1 Tax=Salinicoccus sp. ID82-1 TaxID=2820269 RepID=UPI001F2AEF1D|nr:hypothetical protein [Salinicoccus sp. ID82-1]MCG1009241.1 hypothetical protein [Salinicoccus sp. ID82-1]
MSKGNNEFTVIKHPDFKKYCDGTDLENLELIAHKIQMGRISEGKNPSNSYIVINQDEPYADEVIEILKRNGHWG